MDVSDGGFDRHLVDEALRFIGNVGGNSEWTSHILRAHILIEEKLREIVLAAAYDEAPILKQISKRKLRFEWCLALANAYARGMGDAHIRDAVETLNTLRNAVGHEIDESKLDEKMGVFLAACSKSETWRNIVDQTNILAMFDDYCGLLYTRLAEIARYERAARRKD